jgi:hypothetical protein
MSPAELRHLVRARAVESASLREANAQPFQHPGTFVVEQSAWAARPIFGGRMIGVLPLGT